MALREIRKAQKSTDLLFRKLPFSRLVREIGQDYKTDMRWSSNAMAVLQNAAEDFLVTMFNDVQYLACHASKCSLPPPGAYF